MFKRWGDCQERAKPKIKERAGYRSEGGKRAGLQTKTIGVEKAWRELPVERRPAKSERAQDRISEKNRPAKVENLGNFQQKGTADDMQKTRTHPGSAGSREKKQQLKNAAELHTESVAGRSYFAGEKSHREG